MLNLALQPPPIHPPPPALSPVGEYSFNLPQSRMSEQQMHLVTYDAAPSPSRASFAMAPPPEQHKPSPPVHISPAANGNASGSNAQPSPSRPRREASNVVIACRQWCVLITATNVPVVRPVLTPTLNLLACQSRAQDSLRLLQASVQ